MSQHSLRTIPIAPLATEGTHGALTLPLAQQDTPELATATMDARSRPLRDLRISVTDRCNFRCGYCMPRSAFGRDHAFLPHSALLNFEEITRVASLFLSLGVNKLRITGGEPLLRKELDQLIRQLASLRTQDGQPPDIALTTNGTLLARQAQALQRAGLQRVTVSLDALDDTVFRRMSDADIPVSTVLEGMAAAQAAGLRVKVNMVVQRGVNEDQVLPMVRHFKGSGMELRFIEYMDVGHTNRWNMAQVLPSDVLRERIHAEFPLKPVAQARHHDTAQRWAHADDAGHLGFISSVTQAFCGNCSRLRLSTDGRLYTCLFAEQGFDLRSPLRNEQVDDVELRERLAALWRQRTDRYSELRASTPSPVSGGEPSRRIEMSYIGG